jgi:hypothetical protein
LNALISTFAAEHRLDVVRDRADNIDIIPGREGRSHIFQYSNYLLAVMNMPDTGTAHRWKAAREEFLRIGMAIRQDADDEGSATFDPGNPEQVRAALRYAKVTRKREVSETVLQRLKEVGFQ